MNELYGSDFTFYLPICYAGFAFSDLIWPNIVSSIVNPSNLSPTIEFIENGESVLYFESSVIRNYEFFLVVQLCLHLAVLTTLSLFFQNQKMEKSRVSRIFGNVIRGNPSAASVLLNYQVLKNNRKKDDLDQASIRLIRNKSRKINENRSKLLGNLKANLEIPLQPTLTFTKNEPRSDLLPVDSRSYQVMNTSAANISQLLPNSPNAFQSIGNTAVFDQNKLCENAPKSDDVIISTRKIENSNQPKLKKSLNQKSIKIIEQSFEKKEKANSARSKLFHLNFICIFLVCIVHTTTNGYYMMNFKILGLYYFKNDALINTVGSLAFVAHILMNFIFGFIYSYLGMKYSYAWTFWLYTAINIIYGLFPDNLFLFAAFSCIHRVS